MNTRFLFVKWGSEKSATLTNTSTTIALMESRARFSSDGDMFVHSNNPDVPLLYNWGWASFTSLLSLTLGFIFMLKHSCNFRFWLSYNLGRDVDLISSAGLPYCTCNQPKLRFHSCKSHKYHPYLPVHLKLLLNLISILFSQLSVSAVRVSYICI